MTFKPSNMCQGHREWQWSAFDFLLAFHSNIMVLTTSIYHASLPRRHWLKIANFGTPSLFGAPCGIRRRNLTVGSPKLEWWCHYRQRKKFNGKFSRFEWHNTPTWQTDRQTDRQSTDRQMDTGRAVKCLDLHHYQHLLIIIYLLRTVSAHNTS